MLVRMRPQANFFQDFDRLFNGVASANLGKGYDFDLYETDESMVLEMAVPGIKTEDLDISLEGRQLTIAGKYPETEDASRRYWVKGIAKDEFNRVINLPTHIQTDHVQAQVRDGVLSLTMPKVAEAKSKKISISN
jgi:HSP20 family protein